MENNFYEQERQLEQGAAGLSLGRYTARTFLIMFLGLMVSFGMAAFIAYTWPGFYLIRSLVNLTGGYLHIILLVAQLALSWAMMARMDKISVGTAMVYFVIHCLLIGFVVGTWLLLYQLESVVLVFAATALYFGGVAVFGYVTNIDLSRMRNVLLTGLIFLIIMNVAMWFIPAVGAMEQAVCTIGVILFLAYTAYDTQMIKRFYAAFQQDEEMLRKASILAALELCLDFVNMFLYLLRLLGKRRN